MTSFFYVPTEELAFRTIVSPLLPLRRGGKEPKMYNTSLLDTTSLLILPFFAGDLGGGLILGSLELGIGDGYLHSKSNPSPHLQSSSIGCVCRRGWGRGSFAVVSGSNMCIHRNETSQTFLHPYLAFPLSLSHSSRERKKTCVPVRIYTYKVYMQTKRRSPCLCIYCQLPMPSMPLTTSPALVSLRTTSLSHLATYHLTSHLKQQHHHHFRRLLHFPPTYPTASPKSHTLSCRISPTSLLVGRNLVRALIHTTASASSFSPTARRASPPMSSSSPHPPPPQEVKIKAITLRPGGGAAVELVPLPTLRDDCILVRPTALGLNPTDWKSAEPPMFGPDPAGCRVGCDYAGVVEEVGPAVTKGFKIGSRVAGFAHGSNQVRQEDGAFAERIVVKGDLQIEIPENLSDVEAATLGVGITTVVSFVLLFSSSAGPWIFKPSVFLSSCPYKLWSLWPLAVTLRVWLSVLSCYNYYSGITPPVYHLFAPVCNEGKQKGPEKLITPDFHLPLL